MSKVEILYVTNSGLIIRQLKGSEIIPKTAPFSVDYRTLRGVFTNNDSILLRFTFKFNWQSYAATATFYAPREILIKIKPKKSEPRPFVSSKTSSHSSSWSSNIAGSPEWDFWFLICCTIISTGWSNIVFPVFPNTRRFFLKNGLNIISNTL